ncbi:MAG: hypothetical protein E7220_05575, partial [Clostridiales bacterium]|nr:hypothetical protein [Clostridiales bacterium]
MSQLSSFHSANIPLSRLLMIRRAPTEAWTTEYWQNEMKRAETCIECGMCKTKCPYGLDTPRLLKENIEDYKKVLSGEIKVN